LKKKTAWVLAVVFLFTVLAFPVAAASPETRDIRVTVDGREINLAVKPIMVNGQVLVPLRGVVNHLGIPLLWDAGSKTMTDASEKVDFRAKVGSPWVQVGQGKVSLKTPVAVINGTVYVSLDFLSQVFGVKVYWDPASRTVAIYYPGNEPEQPSKKGKLEYSLDFDQNTRKLTFKVTNGGKKPVELTFPSGKSADFIIYDSKGKEVWQASDGKFYTMSLRREVLAAGKTLTFQEKAPKLAAGKYRVDAYFEGVSKDEPVASKSIKIAAPQQRPAASKLNYGLYYQPNWKQSKLVFTMANPTKKEVSVPRPEGKVFKVVVYGNNGSVWRLTVPEEAAGEKTAVASGSVFRKAINLPKLPRGKYYAEAYYTPASTDRPVAYTNFSVR
jgi:hypothetical protein